MVTFMKNVPLGFIGAGVVGSSLAIALSNAGYGVTSVASRTHRSACMFADRLPSCEALSSPQDVVDNVDFVFITTPDDTIRPICESLSWRSGQGVAHCSGVASIDLLQNAADQGAQVGAFHPMQAFNSVDNGVAAISGSTFGIEGDDRIHSYLVDMATDIGGRPISLSPNDKVLYHVSGVLMGGLLAGLGCVAASLWERFGLTRDDGVRALTPMMRTVAANLEASGVPQALQGPIPRGDIGTICKHLDAISADTQNYLRLYSELALASLPFAVEKGTIGPERAEEIKELVDRYTNTDKIRKIDGD